VVLSPRTPAAALFAWTPTPALGEVFVFSATIAADVESVDDSTGSFLNVGMANPFRNRTAPFQHTGVGSARF
jgi:hypothetical protein